ncbi:MAG: hypothetical protein ABI145_08595 [Steroidobacteraceae bacterium]
MPKKSVAAAACAKTSTKGDGHQWQFPTRIRPKSFSWKSSRLAVQRIKEAVTEIKNVARKDATTAAEGAVRLIERLSPALEHVDSSSGSLGNAVNWAIEEMVPIIAAPDVSSFQRQKWLERLHAASESDGMPYLETLGDHWGELCVTKEIAGHWADELVGITGMALSPDLKLRGHFHGTTACLSALLRAERYEEIYSLLHAKLIWAYQRWAVKALAAQGKNAQAIEFAEASRGPWTSDTDVNRLCEEILLSSGMIEEAYRRYGLYAHRAGTYLASFRAVAKTYPSVPRAQMLLDLIETTPGEEGKWFATAKELGLYEIALKLVRESPCDPKTLARAARDFADKEPVFAQGAGFAALYWLTLGQGYEITSLDVWGAYYSTLKAAEHLGNSEDTKIRIKQLVAQGAGDGFVRQVLGRELALT